MVRISGKIKIKYFLSHSIIKRILTIKMKIISPILKTMFCETKENSAAKIVIIITNIDLKSKEFNSSEI